MKFESNLSEKDKKTIALVLGAAVTFMVVWFGIRPAINDIKELDEKIKEASLVQTEYKNKIINLSTAEVVFDDAVTELSDSTEDYYPIMQSSDIDRMMTSYVLGFGLYPETMNITMPTDTVVENPYAFSDVEINTPRVTATPTPTPQPGTGTGLVDSLYDPYNRARYSAVSTSSSGVYCVGLSFTVTGTPEDCQALINDLSVKPSIRLTGFEWSEVDPIAVESEEDGTIEYVDSGLVRLRVDFNLYMTDVADYVAIVEEAVDAVVVEE